MELKKVNLRLKKECPEDCEGETEKALLIAFEGKKEIWVSKSTIRSNFDSNITETQKFEIDT